MLKLINLRNKKRSFCKKNEENGHLLNQSVQKGHLLQIPHYYVYFGQNNIYCD